MRIVVSIFLFFFISQVAFAQNEILEKNKWSSWKTDTAKMDDGSFNVLQKRTKFTNNDCLVTEEIIMFYDKCGNLTRKIKIRSDCRRNIGEGNIVREREFRRKCDLLAA